MAGLEELIPLIYHEKQQPGSMLCAQHALNALLQGNYYSAPDLSEIARSLDQLEESYRDESTDQSRNMDDTGFFSVQVLENALNVWGLGLVRWRSEDMRPYQDHPHTQLAFILNLNQHWFTLRRFGHASPQMDADEGNGHWLNLNSFLDGPEWVSKLYLGMVLQQAESEGYSVFVVTQIDPNAPLALPRTAADEVGSTLPTPTSAAGTRPAPPSASHKPSQQTGFEDEDLELQAALQASISDDPQAAWAHAQSHWAGASGSGSGSNSPPHASAHCSTWGSGSQTPQERSRTAPSFPNVPFESAADSSMLPPLSAEPQDTVAASMARNQALLQRMQREQEMVLRESYDDEVARFGPAAAAARAPAQAVPVLTEPEGEEDFDETMRRAIQESIESNRTPPTTDENNSGMDIDAACSPAFAPQQHWAGPGHERVYDDDDAELQAALRASLETVPPGFRIPDTPPAAAPAAPPAPAPAAGQRPAAPVEVGTDQPSTPGTETETETETEGEGEAAQQEEAVSMEEMRRRRLARFGGP